MRKCLFSSGIIRSLYTVGKNLSIFISKILNSRSSNLKTCSGLQNLNFFKFKWSIVLNNLKTNQRSYYNLFILAFGGCISILKILNSGMILTFFTHGYLTLIAHMFSRRFVSHQKLWFHICIESFAPNMTQQHDDNEASCNIKQTNTNTNNLFSIKHQYNVYNHLNNIYSVNKR